MLNQAEVSEWIRPEGTSNSDTEVQHLVMAIDSNEDGVISRDEALEEHLKITLTLSDGTRKPKWL